jgi:hypothetical protein
MESGFLPPAYWAEEMPSPIGLTRYSFQKSLEHAVKKRKAVRISARPSHDRLVFKRLTFRELEAPAGTLAPVFFSFLGARIAGQVAVLSQDAS